MIDKVLEERLWKSHRSYPTTFTRNALAEFYLPVVTQVARSVKSGLPRSVELSDLEADGFFGLVDAIEKFDSSYGVKFKTYASQRIRGAIIDQLRAIDWVPRSVRSASRQADRISEVLEIELEREPSEEEVAGRLDISVDQHRINKASVPQIGSLDHSLNQSDPEQGSFLDVLASSDTALAEEVVDDLRDVLSLGLEALGQRDQILLWLYYYEGLTLREVGAILGVTDSRVCQIHTKTILDLFQFLTQ
jgi:RNA polymerase sigma factor for flagellar operon FliA